MTTAYTLAPLYSLPTLHVRHLSASSLRGYVNYANGSSQAVEAKTAADVAQVLAQLAEIPGLVTSRELSLSQQFSDQLASSGYQGAWGLYPQAEGGAYQRLAVFAARPVRANHNPFNPARDSDEWAAFCQINNRA